MADTEIVNLDNNERRTMRYTGKDRTFQLGSARIAAAALAPIDPVFEDFLEVACAIFFADSSFRRGGAARPRMGDGWRRRLHITVPVQDLARWSEPTVVAALTDVSQFLTDDIFSFTFVSRDPALGRQGILELDPSEASFLADEVILLSGGLDSFAGALEALSTTDANVLLVSHRSAQKVIPRQNDLGDYLIQHFKGRVRHVKVEAHRISSQARDTTQRSRTLLFAALGLAVAQTFGSRKISFYENGIVSHNLPISPQVVGTMATRTTHPLALNKLNELIKLLQPGSPQITNGFAWLTKTEVVQRIAQHGAEDQIKVAVSCTSVRDQTKLHQHCGKCSQCLDRRFGILAAGLAHEDQVDGYGADVLLAPRDGQAATMAVEWTRHAMQMAEMTPMDFVTSFGPEAMRIMAGYPSMSPDSAAQRILDLHKRHAKAVRDVLTAAIREHAEAIATGSLPAQSLLMMHIGSSSTTLAPSLPRDPRWVVDRVAPPARVAEENHCPDREAPLEVTFFMNEGQYGISVKGLCDVHGTSAKMAHDLKPGFDEDRANGLTPERHRYHSDYQALGWNVSKDAIRTRIRDCRKILATSYEQMFGGKPPGYLLIQSKQSKGYRLDPTIRVASGTVDGPEEQSASSDRI